MVYFLKGEFITEKSLNLSLSIYDVLSNLAVVIIQRTAAISFMEMLLFMD